MTTSAGASDDLTGTVLAGRYRILRLLGSGAMGAVYLGEHLKIGRKDAIKVLRASMERDPEAIARFTRGARNASSIRHPNVCTVYDFGETEDRRAFLAMEYVEGEQLSDTLAREGKIDPNRAVAMSIQVAEALQAAHDKGIVHRDLKPGNIMVGRDRRGDDLVKVVDFDIAKGGVEGEEDEVTRMGFVVGTPEYMSPEQLTGDPLDGRSDLYSLGLVLFKALTGSYPFPAESTQDLMVKKLTEEPLPLIEVAPGVEFHPGLQHLLDRCLQRKAVDRFENAGELSQALRRIIAVQRTGEAVKPPATASSIPPTQTITATPVPPTVQGPAAKSPEATSKGRIPRWSVAAASLLIVAVVAVVWSQMSTGATYLIQAEPGSLTMAPGTSTQVEARVRTEGGDPVREATIQWTTTNAAVVSVSATGLVSALEPGRATVAVAFDEAADSVVVVVEAAPIGVAIAPTSLDLSAVAGQLGTTDRARLTGAGSTQGLTLAVVDVDGQPASWLRADWADDGGETWVEVGADARTLSPGRHTGRVEVTGSNADGPVELAVSVTVSPGTEPDPVDRIVIRAEDVDAVLSRQLGNLTGSGGSPARAVRDTVSAVLDLSSLTTGQRARGTYVLASAIWELGDACSALRRAEESVSLAPNDDAYATLRNQLSELCR